MPPPSTVPFFLVMVSKFREPVAHASFIFTDPFILSTHSASHHHPFHHLFMPSRLWHALERFNRFCTSLVVGVLVTFPPLCIFVWFFQRVIELPAGSLHPISVSRALPAEGWLLFPSTNSRLFMSCIRLSHILTFSGICSSSGGRFVAASSRKV